MATAADVALDLDRWYGVAIVLDDPALAAIHVTTSFDPAWTAADAVQRFADLLGAMTETRNDGIHLTRVPHRTVGTPQASSTSRSEEKQP